MTRLALFVAAGFLAATLPVSAFAQDDAEAKAIRQSIQRYEHALNASDVDAVVKLCTDDAVVMVPNNRRRSVARRSAPFTKGCSRP